eukprot:4502495-Pyramimonas_sp.AAC.1
MEEVESDSRGGLAVANPARAASNRRGSLAPVQCFCALVDRVLSKTHARTPCLWIGRVRAC